MRTAERTALAVEQKHLHSHFLKRNVVVDFYLPKNINDTSALSLLLINDGQDLEKMGLAEMLDGFLSSAQIQPLLCVGIHTGKDRKMEYGTARVLDYMGRGAKAAAYNRFILEELLPFVHTTYRVDRFPKKAFAGFSLGGLHALDFVWYHPGIFSVAGVFSGSLWWRTKGLHEGYVEERDRIMHSQVRKGMYKPDMKFFFTTGSLDETADRNNNGVIDSIDDTLDLIAELEKKGYKKDIDIKYINFEDGTHDVYTWGRGIPFFLLWAFGSAKQ